MNKESSGIYRIRFHGRGGQGMKTASRILGTALFLEGFEVQDAPRYGAERRGAPVFAYIRASRRAIFERGVIRHPDLVVVADETLVAMPVAEVLRGVGEKTVLLISSRDNPASWKENLALPGPVFTLPCAAGTEGVFETRFLGAACAGAAARLLGVVSRPSLEKAIESELAHLGESVIARTKAKALGPHDLMAPHEGCVTPGTGIPAGSYTTPELLDFPFDEAAISAPAVFSPATSVMVRTGLWRTERPVVEYDRCSRCWLCATFCPEGAVTFTGEGYPEIDYDHCKGCLICMAQCPARAIRSVPEHGDESTKGNRAGRAGEESERR